MLSFLYGPTLTSIHDYWKNHSFDKITFISKVMSLLFNMLSRLVIAFLPRSNCLSILWLQSPSTVILDPKKIKFPTVSTFSPSTCSFPSYSHLQSKGLSRVFSSTTIRKHQNSSAFSLLYSPTLTSIHDYWKNRSLD